MEKALQLAAHREIEAPDQAEIADILLSSKP
jgi:hypothetical protein